MPCRIRRLLLQALVISRFVFTAATTIFGAEYYRRQWCRMYVVLWRGLMRWHSTETTPHSYEVLRHAGATNPLLALAQMRAVLLRRITRTGPATLIHLLRAHWALDPVKSWLGQLVDDLRIVAVYQDSARRILQSPCPVAALLESVASDEHWWPRQIKAASKRFAECLPLYLSLVPRPVPVAQAPGRACRQKPRHSLPRAALYPHADVPGLSSALP